MHTTDIDLRLLRVFRAVADSGGFTNAQAVLNVSPSTISNHMAQLESRLGFKLCERGRAGFRLTERGAAFHLQVQAFFQSLHALETQALELREGLSGHLRLGLIDNMITDEGSPLGPALSRFFTYPENSVHTSVSVLSPQEMEAQVLAGELDAAIGIFGRPRSGLCYQKLYSERDVLVCGPTHPLARISDARALCEQIPKAGKVVRTFMPQQEFPFLHAEDETVTASVTNVEAAALLVLHGGLIGFLPHHYAASWIERGQMVALLPKYFTRSSEISLITREVPQYHNNALQVFLDAVNETQAAMCAEGQRS